MQVGEVFVKIGADLSNFKSGLSNVKTATAGLGRAIGAPMTGATSTVGKLGGAIKGVAAVAAGLASGAAVAGGWSWLVSGNAEMEQYQQTLSIVLKDSKKAAETLAWAKKKAAETPFEIPQIVDATAKLAAYGIKAQAVLDDVGDMAAAMGKPLDQAVEAVADAQTGELERLKEFGITKNMLIEKAAQMGKKEIVNAKGQITDMKGLNAALFQLMHERYAGAMKAQSTTLTGMISNLKDWLGTAGRTLGEGVFNKVKPMLANLLNYLNQLASNGTLEAWGAKIGAAFSKIVEVVGNIGKTAAKVAGMIVENWNIIEPILAGVLAGFMAFRTISYIVGVINAIKVAWAGLNLTMSANPIAIAAIAIGLLIAAGVALYKNWDTVKAKALEIWGTIKEFLGGVINAIAQKTGIDFKAMGETIKLVWNVIKSVTSVVWNAIKSYLTMVWDGFKVLAVPVFNFIKNIISTVWNAIKATTLVVWNTIKQAISIVWQAIGVVVNTAVNVVKNVIQLGINIIKGNWSGAWNNIKNIFSSILTGILNGAKLFVGFIKTTFTGLFSAMITFGKNIIEGLWNGIKSLAGEISSRVSNFVKSYIIKPITKALDLNSPSKVTKYHGEMVVEGMALGIEKATPKAEKKAHEAGKKVGKASASAAKEAAEKAAQAAKDALEKNISKMDKLGDAIVTALRKKISAQEKLQTDALDREVKAAEKASDAKIKQYEKEYDAKLKVIDDEAAAKLSSLQSQIDSIDALTEAEEKAIKEKEYQNKVSELEKKIQTAESAEDRADAEKNLQELILEHQREQLLESRKAQIEAFKAQMEQVKEQAQAKKDQLQLELDDKKAKEEEMLQAKLTSLEKEKQAVEEHFGKILEDENLYAHAREMVIDKNQKEIVALLKEYYPQWQNAGQSFGDSLLKGLESKKASIQSVVASLVSLVNSVPAAPKKSTGGNTKVPKYAEGGLITKPTLALIGEREPEYAVPQSKLENFISSFRGNIKDGAQEIVNYITVEISAKEVAEMNEAIDFFNKLPQVARKGGRY